MPINPDMGVLVADGHEGIRRIVVGLLSGLGFTSIRETGDGLAAWDAVQSGGLGLVVADWDLPGLKGSELLRRMRSSPELSKVPFLLILSGEAPRSLLDALEAGVSGVLPKPFSKEILREKIMAVVRRADELAEQSTSKKWKATEIKPFVFNKA